MDVEIQGILCENKERNFQYIPRRICDPGPSTYINRGPRYGPLISVQSWAILVELLFLSLKRLRKLRVQNRININPRTYLDVGFGLKMKAIQRIAPFDRTAKTMHTKAGNFSAELR